MSLMPLVMAPHFTRQPWGGDALERLYEKAIPGIPTGESWEASVLPEGPSRVARGPHAGRRLARMAALWGRDLLGDQKEFGLLIKFIDARERLSVQVHPNDAFARAHGGTGKTEAWVILNADRNAHLILGVDADRAELEHAAAEGRLEDVLRSVPVAPGEAYEIPAGLVHAVGASILLYEVQQSSDTTYRLHDWDRGREIHLELGLAAAQPELASSPAKPRVTEEECRRIETLVDHDFFALERWLITGKADLVSDPRRYAVVTALDPVVLTWGEERLPVALGETAVIPAALGTWSVEPLQEDAILLCARPAA